MERGVCAKYQRLWAGVTDRKGLFDMGMSIQGVEFFADSIAFGWGDVKAEYVADNFADLVNGKYISKQDGYTSEMYIGEQSRTITARTTLLVLVGVTKAVVNIPEYSACMIYLCGSCDVEINNNGTLRLYDYGDNISYVHNATDAKYKKKKIEKTQWPKKI